MQLLNEYNFKIYVLDNLLAVPTNLYNNDGTINENCHRTEIGQLHYDLKILNKKENVPLISNMIINQLKQLNKSFDVILPVPSKSNNNINMVCLDISKKINVLMLDSIRKIDNEFIILNERELENKKILLIDDTYNTGRTLKAIYNKIKHLSTNVTAITFVRNR